MIDDAPVTLYGHAPDFTVFLDQAQATNLVVMLVVALAMCLVLWIAFLADEAK